MDQFKKGSETLNYHAREFVRALDTLSGDKLLNGGVRIGRGLGKINVRLEGSFHADLRDSFSRDKPDHHILNTAYQIAQDERGRDVILVSKDVNLRMKAKSLGLPAQDYKSDQVQDLSELYHGRRTIEDTNDEIIDALYALPYGFSASDLKVETPLTSN